VREPLRAIVGRAGRAGPYLLLMGVAAGLGFAKAFAFAKILGAASFSYYALLDLVVTFGPTVGAAGLLEGLNRDLPLLLGAGRVLRARALAARGAGAVVVLAVAALSVFAPVVWIATAHDRRLSVVLILGGVLSAANNVFLYVSLQLLAHRRNTAFAALLAGKNAVVLLAGLACAKAFGLWGVIGGEIAGVMAVAIVGAVSFGSVPAVRFGSFRHLRKVFRVGIPLMLGALVGVVGRNLDRMIVALSLPVAVFGQYSFAMLVGVGGLVAWNVLTQWITPRVCHAVGAGASLSGQRERLDKLTLGLVAAGLLAYPLFCFALDRFLLPLYPDFGVGFGLMKVLYFGAVFQMALVLYAIPVAAGASGTIFAQSAGVAALSAALCLAAWLAGGGARVFALIYVAHRAAAALLAFVSARRVAP
jgi:O-antigen/teichoic acid export membrane protein